MSTTLVEPRQASVDRAEPERHTILRPLGKFVAALVRIFVGMALCYHYLTSLLVVGWTFRLMRRRLFRGFWKASPSRTEIPFADFLDRWEDLDVASRAVPRWFAVERFRERIARPKSNGTRAGRFRRLFRIPPALLGGLALNLKTGVSALFCTYILTGPACVLWLGSWYAGWNNSFNKGYEQALVGPLTGILGIVLFIAAMHHLPLAWAHLAATGDARAFFSFGFIRKLATRKPLGTALLALFIALATLPVSIARAAPTLILNNGSPISPPRLSRKSSRSRNVMF